MNSGPAPQPTLGVAVQTKFGGLLRRAASTSPGSQGSQVSPAWSLADGKMIFYLRTLVFWLENLLESIGSRSFAAFSVQMLVRFGLA